MELDGTRIIQVDGKLIFDVEHSKKRGKYHETVV